MVSKVEIKTRSEHGYVRYIYIYSVCVYTPSLIYRWIKLNVVATAFSLKNLSDEFRPLAQNPHLTAARLPDDLAHRPDRARQGGWEGHKGGVV